MNDEHSSLGLPPSADEPEAPDTDAAPLLAWLPALSQAEPPEDEPTRYASPPCYLAEFFDADGTDSFAE